MFDIERDVVRHSFLALASLIKGDNMPCNSLGHTKWDHIYHVVFVPCQRKKVLYGKVRKFLGSKFGELASQRGGEILEGHMVKDHVHMAIRIPPKYSVSEVIGYVKGKSAIAVARQFSGKKRNFNGEKLWAGGCASSIVGFNERQVRHYIKHQEDIDPNDDQNGGF